MLAILGLMNPVQAGDIPVLNGSFESPETSFADPRMDSWQKAPEPAWYNGGGGFPWEQLAGQFVNTTNGSPDHLENLDGKQAAFLFAVPDVALSQDNNTIGGTNTAPTHEFHARFEPGKSYTLTVGVLGGGGGMTNGVTLRMSLYYRDAASNVVTVATTTITNAPGLFLTSKRLIDFQARTDRVRAEDAWAGQPIGIQLASTVGFELQGGYWDLDNVRLTESLVPNGSFESPETAFADPRVDAWQKTTEPPWYMGGGGFPWDQLVGQFINTTNGSSDHIDNVEGRQAAFLFAVPDAGIFQDYLSLSGTNSAPDHAFDVKFEPGNSYRLTVGVLGGGGGMTNGVTLEIALYYRDAASNQVVVGSTTLTNSSELFPSKTHLTDFQASVPTVQAGDPWAGQQLGIRILSTVGFDLQGGYWDLDHVRLDVLPAPRLTALGLSANGFQFMLESAPGQFEVLASTNVEAPSAQWTSLGILANPTGRVIFTDPRAAADRSFYQVRLSP